MGMETRLIVDLHSEADPGPQLVAVVASLQKAGFTLFRADRFEMPAGAIVTSLLPTPEPTPVAQADGSDDE